MLKAVIFDMDGVLIDSESLHYESIHDLISYRGYVYTVELLHKYCGMSEEELWPKLKIDIGMIDGEPEELQKEHWQRYRQLIEERGFPKFLGTKEFLLSLKKAGYSLAVASGSPKEIIREYLSELDLEECFDVVTSGQECEKSKPEPDVFFLTAERLGVLPEECMVIEDSINGMIAAKRAGMKWIGFNGAKIKPNLELAPFIFSDYRKMTVEKLIEWFENFPKQNE